MAENRAGTSISWDKATEDNFFKILEEIPALIRGVAETLVSKKAEKLALSENRQEINEKDMVDAFFAETPAGFVPAMKESMNQLKIDYTKYGHEK